MPLEMPKNRKRQINDSFFLFQARKREAKTTGFFKSASGGNDRFNDRETMGNDIPARAPYRYSCYQENTRTIVPDSKEVFNMLQSSVLASGTLTVDVWFLFTLCLLCLVIGLVIGMHGGGRSSGPRPRY